MTPKSLNELTHHPELTKVLVKLANTNDFSNLMFCGPAGSGKHTRIRCFLNDLFESSAVHDRKIEDRDFKMPSKSINVRIYRSLYHVEITPSNYEVYDRIVIQEIIKEVAEAPIMTRYMNKIKLKVIVIDQADQLSKLAQQALRRTMEKYSKRCRIILCCENYSKVIEPLRSRTLFIRVPAPSKKEMANILNVDQKHLPKTSNIRKAQLMNMSNITKMEWEEYICNLAKDIIDGKPLLNIREYFYKLLSVGVPDYIIFQTLTNELIRLQPENQHKIIDFGQHYQHRSVYGQKSLYHLEAFAANVQAI